MSTPQPGSTKDDGITKDTRPGFRPCTKCFKYNHNVNLMEGDVCKDCLSVKVELTEHQRQQLIFQVSATTTPLITSNVKGEVKEYIMKGVNELIAFENSKKKEANPKEDIYNTLKAFSDVVRRECGIHSSQASLKRLEALERGEADRLRQSDIKAMVAQEMATYLHALMCELDFCKKI